MTAMKATAARTARTRAARVGAGLAALALAVAASGCATGHPRPIRRLELAEARTFPYFRIYWVGPSFEGHPLAAADGLKSYLTLVGDSVYYGDCAQTKGVFAGGSCVLPLQVTTVVYHLHRNSNLGPQRNILVRGVPATVYDQGRSIEVYSGRVAIDIFSDTEDHALAAAEQLRSLNAAGSATASLPRPVYCPLLSGPQEAQVSVVMQNLPGRACQRAATATAFATALSE
jgi:hypothetical protein